MQRFSQSNKYKYQFTDQQNGTVSFNTKNKIDLANEAFQKKLTINFFKIVKRDPVLPFRVKIFVISEKTPEKKSTPVQKPETLKDKAVKFVRKLAPVSPTEKPKTPPMQAGLLVSGLPMPTETGTPPVITPPASTSTPSIEKPSDVRFVSEKIFGFPILLEKIKELDLTSKNDPSYSIKRRSFLKMLDDSLQGGKINQIQYDAFKSELDDM